MFVFLYHIAGDDKMPGWFADLWCDLLFLIETIQVIKTIQIIETL